MEGIVMDPALANLDDIARASQAAWRRAANLDVGFFADRLQLKHGVEGRDFQHADVCHFQEIGDRPDRRFRDPSFVLLLHPPKYRDYSRGLSSRRIFRDLGLSEVKIFLRERKARGLYFLWCEAADGHCGSVSHCMRRAALAFRALIRSCQKALAVPNTL